MPVMPFRAPAGIRMIRIDRTSGKRVYGAWPGDDPKSAVIWEAFKPESEPRRSIRRDELPVVKKKATTTSAPSAAKAAKSGNAAPRDSEFLQREGGIY
jgi:penicillin-binding protein 1A